MPDDFWPGYDCAGKISIDMDGVIYTSYGGSELHAIDPVGNGKWVAYGYTNPAISTDGNIYAVNPGGSINILNKENGSVLAYAPTSASYINQPTIGSNGNIYVIGQGPLNAFSSDLTKLWETENLGNFAGGPGQATVGPDGVIYVNIWNHFDSKQYLHAIKSDGTKKWVLEMTQPAGSPIIGNDGIIYVAGGIYGSTGGLSAIDSSGSLIWSEVPSGKVHFQDSTSPVMGDDGIVYVLGAEYESGFGYHHYLYAINTSSTGPANSSWPMMGANAQHTYRVTEPQSEQVTLTLSLDPETAGKIQIGPPGEICETTCVYNYDSGTPVILSAEDNDGWGFDYWDDGVSCYYDNPITIEMDSDKHFTAVFTADELIEGWSSETGYQWADTQIRQDIIQTATEAIGSYSGQSTIYGSWLTDITGGDGRRIRKSINIYDKWRKSNNYDPNNTEKIKIKMQRALANSYNGDDSDKLVNHIIHIYEDENNTVIPQNDEETLQYLSIQQQCLEWAMTIAINAGGQSINYAAIRQGLVDPVEKENVRPGMGYYHMDYSDPKKPKTHAMIIIDVYYNGNGIPTKIEVAESNWGSKWRNPGGQIPWERTVGNRNGEELPLVVNDIYNVVNYDPKESE